MNVLVIDIGGSHVKLIATEHESTQFDSHRALTPQEMIKQVLQHTKGWNYDVVSLGYPGIVGPKGPVAEPGNLGDGWVGFDYSAALGKPVRLVNDAVLQALGGYDGGRMLFLGLGTGLGSALISEHVAIPLELGGLLFATGEMMHERLGRAGLDRLGEHAWMQSLIEATDILRRACLADYVLIGGGNAANVDPLPPYCRRGGNEDAFKGGFMFWEEEIIPHERKASDTWRVVR